MVNRFSFHTFISVHFVKDHKRNHIRRKWLRIDAFHFTFHNSKIFCIGIFCFHFGSWMFCSSFTSWQFVFLFNVAFESKRIDFSVLKLQLRQIQMSASMGVCTRVHPQTTKKAMRPTWEYATLAIIEVRTLNESIKTYTENIPNW